MLYVVIGNSASGKPIEFGWHVGETTGSIPKSAGFVTEVQADGDELDYVRHRFRHLPMRDVIGTHGIVERWFGDHAKFIAGNL